MTPNFDPDLRDWEWVCLTVLPRLGMWTGRVSFDRAVAFISGFDAAQSESIHPLMNNRNEARLGRRTPLTWTTYVLAGSLGVDVNDLPAEGSLTDDQHLAAIAALRAELLDGLNIAQPDL